MKAHKPSAVRKRLRHKRQVKRGKNGKLSRTDNLLKQYSDPEIRNKKFLATAAKAYFEGKGRRPTPEQVEALRVAGWIPKGENGSNGDYPRRVSSAPTLAKLITHRFKIPCSRQQINQWRNRMPNPFPPVDTRGERDVQECFDWVEKHIINVNGKLTGDLYALAQDEKVKGDIEREQHERWQREKERGGWIEMEQHEATLSAAGTAARMVTRDVLEVHLPNTISAAIGLLTRDKDLQVKIGEAVRAACRKQFDEWQLEVGKRIDGLEAKK